MKRVLVLLVVLALSVSVFTGCDGGAAAATGRTELQPLPEVTEDTKAGVTLNVVTSYGGDDGNRRKFEQAVASYERVTGNKVSDGSATSNEEWKARVLTDFDTGSEPDVLFFFTNADADPIIDGGKVVSIEEIRDVYPDYATNMKDSMLTAANDGKHYAVPASGFWENLFVNKTVLNDCDIPIPGPNYTWDQFLEDCETIKKRGYTPIACSLFEVPHYWFEFAVMNNGTLENQLEIPKLDHEGNLLADDPAGMKWVAALNDIKDLYERGFFPSNTLTATDAETVSLFGEGKAAFLVDGSWKVGYFSENHADSLEDYAIAFVPGKGERRASETIGGISMGYFITRKAWDDPEKREAAVKFVAHMTADEILSSFVTTEVTALVNGTKTYGLNEIQKSAAKANANLTGIVDAVQDSITGEAKSDLFANIQKVVTGQMTAEEAVASAIKLND